MECIRAGTCLPVLFWESRAAYKYERVNGIGLNSKGTRNDSNHASSGSQKLHFHKVSQCFPEIIRFCIVVGAVFPDNRVVHCKCIVLPMVFQWFATGNQSIWCSHGAPKVNDKIAKRCFTNGFPLFWGNHKIFLIINPPEMLILLRVFTVFLDFARMIRFLMSRVLAM